MNSQEERQHNLAHAGERVTAATGQASKAAVQAARERVKAVTGLTSDMAETIGDQTRGILGRAYHIMNRFPPLKYGVYTMGILSAIPVGMFIGFLAISFGILCAVAAVIVSLLEGGAILVGGTFLVPTLFVAGIVTFFIVGGFVLAWITSYAIARAWGLVAYLFSFAADEVSGDVQAIEGGTKRGVNQWSAAGRREE